MLKPYDAEALVKALKQNFPTLPVELHTHYTAGLASMTLMKAIEAGCDIVDTGNFSYGHGHFSASYRADGCGFAGHTF